MTYVMLKYSDSNDKVYCLYTIVIILGLVITHANELIKTVLKVYRHGHRASVVLVLYNVLELYNHVVLP